MGQIARCYKRIDKFMNIKKLSSNINSNDVTANSTEIYRPTVHYGGMRDRLPKMTKGEKAAFYKMAFDDLLQLYAGQDTITLYGERGSKPRTTTFAELEACKQIYTEDRTEKFWKVRNYLNNSEQRFFSPSGSLVSVKARSDSNDFGLYYISPEIRGNKKKYRDCFNFRNRKDKTGGKLATAKLAILVFNGNCSVNAMRVLDEEGPEAIFNKIDVHHLYGFKVGSTPEEIEQNICENCKLESIQLLTKEEHALFNRGISDTQPEITASKADFLSKAADLFPNGAVIQSYGNRYGRIIDGLPERLELDSKDGKAGKLEMIHLEQISGCSFYICKKDGTYYKKCELEPQIENLAEEIVKKMSEPETAKPLMFEKVGLNRPFLLGDIYGVNLYGIYHQERKG